MTSFFGPVKKKTSRFFPPVVITYTKISSCLSLSFPLKCTFSFEIEVKREIRFEIGNLNLQFMSHIPQYSDMAALSSSYAFVHSSEPQASSLTAFTSIEISPSWGLSKHPIECFHLNTLPCLFYLSLKHCLLFTL